MNERIIQILISSFTKILIPGIKVTIPLTILSFTFGCIIALFLALVQVANVKGLKQFARFYIWIFWYSYLSFSSAFHPLASFWTRFRPQ